MITSLQIRAARALKRWSVAQAARECETSHKTMLRAEMGEGVPNLRAATLEKIQRGFEAAGIEFIAENRHGTGGVGVRLRRQP